MSKREFLLHVNVQAPEGDSRTLEDIERAVAGAIEVGSDAEILKGLEIEIVLAEEVS